MIFSRFRQVMNDNLGGQCRIAAAKLEEMARKLVASQHLEQSIATTGHAASEILAVARRRKVDMIVMTTHGHSGLRRFFMGSTAEQVVRHAHCPVLSVRRS